MTNGHLNEIVFINQDAGYLMIDIVNAHVNSGYACTLITGRLVERNTALDSSVKVNMILRYDRSTFLKRMFTSVIAFLQIYLIVIIKYRGRKLFIVSNPPFAPLLPLMLRNPFTLLIYDIFPDVLAELGYVRRKSLIMRLWENANKRVFTKAGKVFTITQSMQNVLTKYMIGSNPEMIPIWTDNEFLKPVDPNLNPFIRKNNLTGKFIVLYSGNIGLSTEVDTLIDVAAEINNEHIVILIIGEGARKESIKQMVVSRRLKNVLILPWQLTSELPNSLSSASIAVVTLGKQGSKLAIPSKLYNYLSVGAPILCITPKGSEVEKLVSNYECGESYEADNISGMVGYIDEMFRNKELYAKTRFNSLKASRDFQSGNAQKFVLRHIN